MGILGFVPGEVNQRPRAFLAVPSHEDCQDTQERSAQN